MPLITLEFADHAMGAMVETAISTRCVSHMTQHEIDHESVCPACSLLADQSAVCYMHHNMLLFLVMSTWTTFMHCSGFTATERMVKKLYNHRKHGIC